MRVAQKVLSTMDQLHQGAELLGNYLDQVEHTLKFSETNLAKQFETAYVEKKDDSPSAECINPVKLLARMKALEAELPTLLDEAMNIAEESRWFSQAMMEESGTTASALLTALDATQSNSIALRNEAFEADNALHEALKRHRDAVNSYNMRHEYLRERTIAGDTVVAPEPPAELPREQDENEPVAKSTRKKSGDGGARPRVRREPPPRKEGVLTRKKAPAPAPASSDGFVEIPKAAFNRLPRNLKGGSTLKDLNELYRRIYDVLSNHRGPMPEDELLEAAGETSAQKLASLRGLSVLRRADSGWYLTNSKR